MSTNFNTCFIDSNGRDVSEEFVEKSYLLNVYPNLIDAAKAPSLWTTGCNLGGALGDNTVTLRSSPVQTVSGGTNWKRLSSYSGDARAAIKNDGTLWVWGFSDGRIGDNTIVTRSSPVQTISGGTNWRQVSGSCYNTAAVKTDGTLWLWGNSNYGQIGDNVRIARSSPVQTVSTGTNWKQVSVGGRSAAAVKTDGTLWLWGSNGYGRLGDNTIVNKSSPVQTISTGTNWKQVSVNENLSAAIKTDGTLWTWGCGAQGGLGNDSITNRSSPVQTVSAGTNWKQVGVGGSHMASIKTDGTLWVWGAGNSGQLGRDAFIFSVSSPVQTISGGTNWRQVAAGSVSTASIKTDGTLWLWGINSDGRLGTGSAISVSSPVQTISGGNNWKQVAAGVNHTAAIREEGDW